MGDILVRDADLVRDRPVILGFIDGLQRFEHALEPDRRIDGAVAGEYFEQLAARLLATHGGAWIAEHDGRAVGWSVAHEAEDDAYVEEIGRRYGYIAELFIIDAARGIGAGRALIQACEGWARARGLAVMQIGVLPGNVRARSVYAAAGYAPYTFLLRRKIG
jgi:GNAT superfamily N-acetyltransferase